MAVLPVVKYGDPILRKKVESVKLDSIDTLTEFIDDMSGYFFSSFLVFT